MMNIETDRLLIRNFRSDDLKDVYEYMSDKNVLKYIPEGSYSREEIQKFIEENKDYKSEKFPIILKSDNLLLEHIAFHQYFGGHTYL